MYIEIVSRPTNDTGSYVEELLEVPMDVDPSNSGSDTAIPDIITAQYIVPTPTIPIQEPGIQILFEGDHPEPLWDNEDLVELEFECPHDGSDPVRSLLTLINNFQEYLADGGDDINEPVEVFELEAPP
jgi:hypothetical protein